LDLVDASLVGGPAGALCFGPFANWINTGSDGCADNSKFTTGVTPFPLAFDDNRLNPYFGPVYGPGILSDVYQLDHPMGVLLTEGTGKYFAAAFFATLSRQRNPNDASAGSFDLSMVTNGDPNPLVQGRHNIIPWQLVPQPFISVVGQIEDVGTSPRIVTAVITPPRVIHDGSVRPSGAPAAVLGGAPGVGVLDQAGGDPRSLIRFVFENAPLTVAGVCGTYLPVHEVPIGQATTTFIVPADTCLRMVTHFGRRPQTQTCSQNNASVALTGDIGYNVSSVEVFIGEGLASDGLAILSARRQRGQSVAISFRTASELNVMQLALFGRDARGRERLLATLQPRQGSTGLGDTYEVTLTKAQLRGARSLYVVAQPSGPRSADVVIK
jgi:hypothetical protein